MKHEENHSSDGWIIDDTFVINEGSDENIVVEATCNHLGCTEKGKFKIFVIDIERIPI